VKFVPDYIVGAMLTLLLLLHCCVASATAGTAVATATTFHLLLTRDLDQKLDYTNVVTVVVKD